MKTFEDFRKISFLIENNDDVELYNFLTKDISHLNSVDKFLILLKDRIKYLDDIVTFVTSENKNINININIFLKNFDKNYKKIKNVITIDDFTVAIDYPKEFYNENDDELLINCIDFISYNNKNLNISDLSKQEKQIILDKIPAKILQKIIKIINKTPSILLMEERVGLSPIEISFFDNSAFEFIKLLYGYYTSTDIIETIFVLSKRIFDIGYLNSRTPKEVQQLLKMFSEEVEKSNK